MTPLLPAPRIAGYLPPPRCVPVTTPNLTHGAEPSLWIMTWRGTFAVLRPECLGELMRELA